MGKVKTIEKSFLDPEEKKHAEFGPSSADRYVNCTASVALSRKFPKGPSSDAADEGTEAHTCLETILLAASPGAARKFLYNHHPREMVDHAWEAAEFLWEKAEGGGVLLPEQKVDISHFTKPGEFGTLDAEIVFEFDKLIIADFKYGAGIFVSAEENLQLIAYALGAAKKYGYNFATVELYIIQPRKPCEEGKTIRGWACTMEMLRSYEERFLRAVAEAEDPLVSSFRVGAWCKFCPGKAGCTALSTWALEEAQIDFNDEEGITSLPAPTHAGVKNLPTMLAAADKLEEWIDGLRAHALNLLKQGHSIPGKKLVAKRGTRKWNDVTKASPIAVKLIGREALTTPELLSPAQLENVAKKKGVKVNEAVRKFLEKHCSNVSSGVTIADEDDKRPAVTPASDEFYEEPAQITGKTVSKEKTVSKKGKKK